MIADAPVVPANADPAPPTASPAQHLTLSGSTQAWLLLTGEANIFVRRAGAAAPRQFLFSIPAPGLLFGVPATDLTVEAVIDPGGTIAAADPATLFARGGDHHPWAIAGVEQWFVRWTAGCARLFASRPPRDLAVADDVIVPAGRIIDGTPGLVWRRIGQGEGALFDLLPIGGDGLDLVPVAPGAWIRAFEPLRLTPLTTRQLLNRGHLAGAVAAALPGLLDISAVGIALEQVDEGLRRGRRRAQIATDTRRVMGDLGRMVGADAPIRIDPAANQALFSAIRLLADRLGVRATTPASVRQAEAEFEPSLDELLRASGLQSRPVRLSGHWLTQGVDDLLAFRGPDKAPVALLRDARGSYRLHDPAAGSAVPLDETGTAELDATAHVLYQPLPDKPLKLADLLFFGLQRSGGDIATLSAAALLGALLGSAPAMMSRLIFDTLIPQHLTGLLAQAGAALTVFAVISALFVYAGNIAMARIRARASLRLKAALWDRVLRQPMAVLARYTAPDLTMRIATAENVVASFHTTAHQSLVTLGFLIVNIATMVFLAPAVALVAVGILLVLVAVTLIAAWAQKRAFTGGEAAEGSTTTFVHALTNGVRKVRLAGAEERGFVKWADRFTRSRMKLINVRKVTNRYAAFVAGFATLGMAGLFLVIAQLATDPVGTGTFFGFIGAFGIAIGSLGSLGRQTLQLAFQLASLPYCKPLLDNPPPLQAKKSNPGRLSGAIEVANVSFAYGEGAMVLSQVSFAAAPGEFVAIVGPTGCGKSTLFKLLLGLETPLAGSVMFDQHDLASLDLDTVRQQIGIVMQRPQMMPASIFENLRGVADLSLDQAWAAARLAGIADEIEAMPMRLHTLMTEGSQTISGGQRQRLALARALARNPAILLLDEATSALDNSAQAEVMANLQGLGCTRIVVAHRLSTVIYADTIIVLDSGRVVESGSYDSLMAAGGLFAQLAAGQSAA